MSFFKKMFGLSSDTKWFKVFDSEEEAKNAIAINRAVTVLIESQKVCMARNTNGFFAVADHCPHLGASLSKGVCNDFGDIVCPWHSYRFNLKLGHETSGQGNGTGVETYKIDIREDGLYIAI